jgi:TrmH family RNA methyltransferase
MQLTSAKNPLLQSIRRAVKTGRPTEAGLLVIEGPNLVAESVRGRSQWRLEQVLTTAAGRERYAALLSNVRAEIIEVAARAFPSISGTSTSQEILALLRPRLWSWEEVIGEAGVVVVLDGIQDPGNAGAIVRSAEAFDAAGVVFLEGCARVANGKFLRATAGSIFRIPFLEGIGRRELADEMMRRKLRLYALAADGEVPVTEAGFRKPCALAVGSEGAGVSNEVLAIAQTVVVPSVKVESLNAAVACSIALFEAARQRRTG